MNKPALIVSALLLFALVTGVFGQEPVKPTITVRVYGQIYVTKPASKSTPGTSTPKKSTNG